MSIVYVTSEIVENENFCSDMETKNCKCACGDSYAYYDPKNEDLLLVVCDSCYEANPRQQY